MKLLFLLLLGFIPVTASEQNHFSEHWKTVHQFIKQHRETITAIPEEKRCHLSESLAIVLPELLRHNWLSDFLETSILEQAYVRGGSQVADFSIGYFQMKPSFIEKLEAHILASSELNSSFGDLAHYTQKEQKARRAERLRRLKQLDYQLKYASCFYQVLNECYNDLPFDESKQLRFFATAYNYGFDRPFDEIEHWMSLKAFPYGPQFDTDQYAYSDYSLYFFQQLSRYD